MQADSGLLAFRTLHLQGRILGMLLPRATDGQPVPGVHLRRRRGRRRLGRRMELRRRAPGRRAPDRGRAAAVPLRGRRAARDLRRGTADPGLDAALADRRCEAAASWRKATRSSRISRKRKPWDYGESLRRVDDAVIVGSGPNGLAAAIELARAGASVRVLEARDEIGGGIRTAELTLPGFAHDVCSGCHPMGVLSPWFRSLPLAEHGLRWIHPPASVAHPLDDEPAVLLRRSLDETASELGRGRARLREALRPLPARAARAPRRSARPAAHPAAPDPARPLRTPGPPSRDDARSAPASADSGRARCSPAVRRIRSCRSRGRSPRRWECSSPSPGTSTDWPVAAGGSQAIGRALASYLRTLGGRIETGRHVRSLADLPPARVVLFDTSPAQLADIGAPILPAGYVRRLRRYRYGPGAFKLDWALDGPIPWRDPALPRGLDRSSRRHARRDRRRRSRRLARRASRAALRAASSSRASSTTRARPPASTRATPTATSLPGRPSIGPT